MESDNQRKETEKRAKDQAKKKYTSPHLTVYGSVGKITETGAGASPDAGIGSI